MSADSSSSILSQPSTVQPQPGSPPTKRGELGYNESLNPPSPSNPEPEADVTARDEPIPARHPADRDQPPPTPQPEQTPITSLNGNQPTVEPLSSSTFLSSLFRPKVTKCGVRVSTILLLVTQGSLLLFTIAFWIVLSKVVLPSSNVGRMTAVSVFIHIAFIVCTIVQVVLLERLVFRYRAERYAMLHPGQIHPDVFSRGEQVSTRLALAPWNRPPLPTYAAVLMESGVGTGDVEDNRIAVAPPPAYGNTRGSTLLLAGFISAELQEQARIVREARGDRTSVVTVASTESNKSSDKSRPVSYRTVDSEWDARCDMSRATFLAETLAQLEVEERDVTTVQVVSPAPTQTGFVNPALPPKSPSPSSS